MFELSAPLSVRLAQEDDKPFFKQLYATTRDDLKNLPVSPQELVEVIEMQQVVQENGLRDVYPGAKQWTILLDEEKIGRLIVDYNGSDWRVIDIAIMPQRRNQGWGRQVLQAVMTHAGNLDNSVSLAVFGVNPGARRLYERLNFKVTRSDRVHAQMIWRKAA
ncbi:GNAT family N-acetyltransferase [Massilia sp. W12]|uniref:GNAT family N-acetyltransferase n=1 Tax=Massilia sp. W12 TaxID=3126507 RepID=UPI0030CD6F97